MLKSIRYMTRAAGTAVLAIAMLATSGCLYPEDNTPGGEASARESINTVQAAVNLYFERTGLLPIQNADESVPLYEKYKIDLGKLQRTDYLGSVPSVAFEKGGRYQFLIIDEETKPQVKLLDIVLYQQVGDIQKKVNDYRSVKGDVNPAGAEAYPGYSFIDYGKLNIKAPDVRSVYSRQPLDLLIDATGQVYVDYAIDIATAITKAESPPKAEQDLRRYLIDASYYVPVKSPVYYWVGDAPQPIAQ